MRTRRDFQNFAREQSQVATVGNVTLAVDPATTTVVEHQGVSDNSCIVLTPTNAAMATEWATTVPYVTTQGGGSFTITHAANANARTIRYVFFTPLSR